MILLIIGSDLASLPLMFWLKVIFLCLIVAFPLWDLLWYGLGVRRTLPWELKAKLHRKGPFLLDVRTPWEYRLMHIPHAVNRPDLLGKAKPLPFNPHHPLVVICMTGHRSPLVAKRLQNMGYTNVTSLAWGMLGWKLAGGRTVQGGGDDERT